MSRILVSFSSHILVDGEYKIAVFYEGLINALARCGNETLILNSAQFLTASWNGDNELKPHILADRLLEEVKAFQPELIIAFNHSIPRLVLEHTGCPVAVWDADSIHYYNDRPYLLAQRERYTFLCFSQAGVANAQRFGAQPSRTHHIQAATDVQAEAIPQDKNISFIGTRFAVADGIVRMLKEQGAAKLLPLAREMNTNFYADQAAIIANHGAQWVYDYTDATALAGLNSVHDRITILNNVVHLGLTLYGTADWYDLATTLPWLAMCYDPQKIYSQAHNQQIYNSSKLCLNISHGQAQDGFPWRVMDIMASNGCLVSDRKSGLDAFTRGYVEIPSYDSPREVADLCARLLKDEPRRRAIVEASQRCIAEKGRWEHRIAELAEIFNLPLVTLNSANPPRYLIPEHAEPAAPAAPAVRRRIRHIPRSLLRRIRARL